MDSGAAGRIMAEGMFPRVKLERKTALDKFVNKTVTWVNRRLHPRRMR